MADNKKLMDIPVNTLLIDERKYPLSAWSNWFNSVYRFLSGAPLALSGSGAPTSIPRRIGDSYTDYTNNEVYWAFSTANNAGWIKIY